MSISYESGNVCVCVCVERVREQFRASKFNFRASTYKFRASTFCTNSRAPVGHAFWRPSYCYFHYLFTMSVHNVQCLLVVSVSGD